MISNSCRGSKVLVQSSVYRIKAYTTNSTSTTVRSKIRVQKSPKNIFIIRNKLYYYTKRMTKTKLKSLKSMSQGSYKLENYAGKRFNKHHFRSILAIPYFHLFFRCFLFFLTLFGIFGIKLHVGATLLRLLNLPEHYK